MPATIGVFFRRIDPERFFPFAKRTRPPTPLPTKKPGVDVVRKNVRPVQIRQNQFLAHDSSSIRPTAEMCAPITRMVSTDGSRTCRCCAERWVAPSCSLRQKIADSCQLQSSRSNGIFDGKASGRNWPFCDTSVASYIPLLSLRRTMTKQPRSTDTQERNAPDTSLRMAGREPALCYSAAQCSLPRIGSTVPPVSLGRHSFDPW